MKAINNKELLKKVKHGDVKRDVFARSLKKPIPHTFDEREPIERVADELEQFSAAVLTMNKQQAEALTQVLKTVMSAIENMSNMKVELPDASESIKQWSIQGIKRDENGLIQNMKVVADK